MLAYNARKTCKRLLLDNHTTVDYVLLSLDYKCKPPRLNQYDRVLKVAMFTVTLQYVYI